MSSLLLINTPQYDYIEKYGNERTRNVRDNIVKYLLHDTKFMKDVSITGLVLDFFPISNKFFDDKTEDDGKQFYRCLSFTMGASIDEQISDNLHNYQNCVLKKLPKNDNIEYECSVLDNIDSGTFLVELLGPRSTIQVDDIYICGFSMNDSIISTLRLFNEFMQMDKVHVIDDLIYCSNPNEKNNIDLFCLDHNIKQHNFIR